MINSKEEAAAFLRKRKIKSEDLGRAMVANLLYLTKHGELLFNQAQCEKLGTKVIDRDGYSYENYIALSRWICTTMDMTDAHKNTLDQIIVTLSGVLTQEMQQQELYIYAANLPVIITQKQADDIGNGNGAGFDDFTKKRALENGLAVLHFLTKRGQDTETYCDPLEQVRFTRLGLSFYTDENKDKDEYIDKLDHMCKLITKEIYYINGYVMALDMMSASYDMELQFLYEKILPLKNKVDDLRSAFVSLHSTILDTQNGFDTYRLQKLDVLEKYLCNIGKDVPDPSEASIEDARNEIRTFGAFRCNYDVTTQLLCILK